MRRRLFFLLERLKITPTERRTVAGLMILLVTLSALNLALSPHAPFDEQEYSELEKQFRQRSAMLKADETRLMRRYNPPPVKQFQVAQDTTPADSAGTRKQMLRPYKKIDVNIAGKEALESLPGIGPVYAQRIIDYRENEGEFKAIEELLRIKGIGEKKLEKLKPFVKLKASGEF